MMLFIPLKRFSLCIKLSMKKCFWDWSYDFIVNEYYFEFSQLESDRGVAKPSRSEKASSLLENLHFIPEGKC